MGADAYVCAHFDCAQPTNDAATYCRMHTGCLWLYGLRAAPGATWDLEWQFFTEVEADRG